MDGVLPPAVPTANDTPFGTINVIVLLCFVYVFACCATMGTQTLAAKVLFILFVTRDTANFQQRRAPIPGVCMY